MALGEEFDVLLEKVMRLGIAHDPSEVVEAMVRVSERVQGDPEFTSEKASTWGAGLIKEISAVARAKNQALFEKIQEQNKQPFH